VMGLHGSPALGPRMGSVTYRMLCLTPTLVLALPPRVVDAPPRAAAVQTERARETSIDLIRACAHRYAAARQAAV
jgi:hypothetical protein